MSHRIILRLMEGESMSGIPGRQSSDTSTASPRYFPPILCNYFGNMTSELFTVINIDSIGAQRSGDSVGVLWAGLAFRCKLTSSSSPVQVNLSIQSLVTPDLLSDTDMHLLFNRSYLVPVWLVTLYSGSSSSSVEAA